MKTTSIIIVLLLAVGIVISGCKKHDNNVVSVIPVGMHATINGAPWAASNYDARLDSIMLPTGSFDVDLFVEGTNTTTLTSGRDDFGLVIFHYKYQPGIYDIGVTGFGGATYYYGSQGMQSYSGTITISQLSMQNIQGSFNCLLYDGISLNNGTKQVTNGQFNVPFQ